MISEMEFLLGLIAGIALMVRWRLFRRLLPAFSAQRIHDELHKHLKVSAPHLSSTFDDASFDSGSSTSR